MRIACVLIPSFAVAVERRASPAFDGTPLAVLDRDVVLDADAAGVRRGLSLRQAKALRPDATFVEANHARYRDVAEAMLGALERVTPAVEPVGLGCAYADIRGLQGHYENEFTLAGTLVEAVRGATGLLASVGIANGKFVAWVAASITSPGEGIDGRSGKEGRPGSVPARS